MAGSRVGTGGHAGPSNATSYYEWLCPRTVCVGLRCESEGDEPFLTVAVVAHEHGELASGRQCCRAIADELLVTRQKLRQGFALRQVARVGAVNLLAEVGRMGPDEIKLAIIAEPYRVARILAAFQVGGLARHAEFAANVVAGSTAHHRVKYFSRLKVQQQVADQVPAAIAGISPVAVLTGLIEVVQAREVWDGATRKWNRRQLRQDEGLCGPHTARKHRIDVRGKRQWIEHGYSPVSVGLWAVDASHSASTDM